MCDDGSKHVDGGAEDRSSALASFGSGTEPVAWFAEKGTIYNIYVRGEDEDDGTSSGSYAGGDFSLHLRTSGNALCESAVSVETSSGGSISGSLTNACSNNYDNYYNSDRNVPEGCYEDNENFQTSSSLRGVWYKVSAPAGNNDVRMTATVSGLDCSKSQLSIFATAAATATIDNENECSSLQCVDNLQSAACDTETNDETTTTMMTSQWTAKVGEVYYLFIQSTGRTDNFDLTIVEG